MDSGNIGLRRRFGSCLGDTGMADRIMKETTVKMGPPAAIGVWEMMNTNLPTAILIGTAIYTLLQIALAGLRFYKEWKEK